MIDREKPKILFNLVRTGNYDGDTERKKGVDTSKTLDGLSRMVQDLGPDGEFWQYDSEQQVAELPTFAKLGRDKSQPYVTEIEALHEYLSEVLDGKDSFGVREKPYEGIIDELVKAMVPASDGKHIRRFDLMVAAVRGYYEASFSLMYGDLGKTERPARQRVLSTV